MSQRHQDSILGTVLAANSVQSVFEKAKLKSNLGRGGHDFESVKSSEQLVAAKKTTSRGNLDSVSGEEAGEKTLIIADPQAEKFRLAVNSKIREFRTLKQL